MRHRPLLNAELDLIPVLSLIVHIIPMLLLNIRFMDLSLVNVGAPIVPIVDAPSPKALEDQDKRLFSVQIDEQGFLITGEGRLPCNGACSIQNYDYSGLKSTLSQMRQRQPEITQLLLAPAPGTSVELLIRVMDSVRTDTASQPLFPSPLLTESLPEPP